MIDTRASARPTEDTLVVLGLVALPTGGGLGLVNPGGNGCI